MMKANMVQLDNPIQGGGEGQVTMEPEARIAPPEGNSKPLKEVSGNGGRVPGASTVSDCLAYGVDGVNGVLSHSPQRLSHYGDTLHTSLTANREVGGKLVLYPKLECMIQGNRGL